MRRHDLSDISDNEIEDRTTLRIRQYEQRVGRSVTLPVPVENIVEQILDLDFDWIDIEEQRGEMILAGLVPEDRRIVLNTRHMELFEEKPGLERSTIGHEAVSFRSVAWRQNAVMTGSRPSVDPVASALTTTPAPTAMANRSATVPTRSRTSSTR